MQSLFNPHLFYYQSLQARYRRAEAQGGFVLWHVSISYRDHTLKETRLTPLGLSTEEYPHPPSHNLQNLHHEYPTFQVVEVI